jgi:hypothetical protein
MLWRWISNQSLSRHMIMLEAVGLWCVLSTIYLLTLSGNHTEAEDSIHYLVEIREGNPTTISDPYHLAYQWLGWLIYHTALTLGYDGGPLLTVQILNAFTGAIGIALLWVLLRIAVPGGRWSALAGCGLLAFSYGYWWYSVEVEVYILSALLLILSLFLAYHAARHPSWKAFALLGGAHGLAVLAHITNVLFVAVPVVALFFAWWRLPVREVGRCMLAYATVGISVIISSYALAALAHGLETPREVYNWLAVYPQAGKWGIWGGANVPIAALGMARAFVGGHFAFALDPIRNLAEELLGGNNLSEETFLMRNFNIGLAVLLAALTAVVSLALVVPVVGWLRHRMLCERSRVLGILCLSWLLSYAPFFVWWEPGNVEFWIAPLVPLTILWALSLSGREHAAQLLRPSVVVPVVLGTLFAVNLLGSVLPQHYPEDDYWRVRASWYERNATPSDSIVATGYNYTAYLSYFARADAVIDAETVINEQNTTASAVVELRRQIDALHASRVLISSAVFYPASDEFSRCIEGSLLCERASAIRTKLMPNTRVLATQKLEQIREFAKR